jgi:TP901 family phage tail tape measure protein
MIDGTDIGELRIVLSVTDNFSKSSTKYIHTNKRSQESVKKLKAEIDVLRASESLLQQQHKKSEVETKKLQLQHDKLTASIKKQKLEWDLLPAPLKKVNSALNSVRWTMVNVGFAALAITGMVAPFAKFGAEIDNLSRKFAALSDNAIGIQDSITAISSIRSGLPFTFEETGNAMIEFVKAGFSVEETIKVMPSILDLATGGFATLGEATTITAQLMHQFNIPAKEAPEILDFLAKAANESATDVITFGNAMAYVGPVAEQAGWSFQETGAAMMILANAGLRGTKSGTALRQAISQLINPTKQSTEMMEKYGITFADANGNIKGASQLMTELAMIVNSFDTEKSQKALAEIFPNIRGRLGVQILSSNFLQTGQTIDDIVEKTNEAGYAQKVAADQYESATNRMKTAWHDFKQNFMVESVAVIETLATLSEFMSKLFGGEKAGWKIAGAVGGLTVGIGLLSKGLLSFFTRGSSPANPQYVSDVGSGISQKVATAARLRDPYTGRFTPTIGAEFKNQLQNVFDSIKTSKLGTAIGTAAGNVLGYIGGSAIGSAIKKFFTIGGFTSVIVAALRYFAKYIPTLIFNPIVLSIAGIAAIVTPLVDAIRNIKTPEKAGILSKPMAYAANKVAMGVTTEVASYSKLPTSKDLESAGVQLNFFEKAIYDSIKAISDFSHEFSGKDSEESKKVDKKYGPRRTQTPDELLFNQRFGGVWGYPNARDISKIDPLKTNIENLSNSMQETVQTIKDRNLKTYTDMKEFVADSEKGILGQLEIYNTYISDLRNILQEDLPLLDIEGYKKITDVELSSIRESLVEINKLTKSQSQLKKEIDAANFEIQQETDILKGLNAQLSVVNTTISNLSKMRFKGESSFLSIISGEKQKNLLEELKNWGIGNVKEFIDKILLGSEDAWKGVRTEIEKTDDVLNNSQNTYDAWKETLNETIKDLITNSQDLSKDVTKVVKDFQTQLLSTSKFSNVDNINKEETTKIDLLQKAYDAYYGNMHQQVSEFIKDDEDKTIGVETNADIIISKLQQEFNSRDSLTTQIKNQTDYIDGLNIALKKQQTELYFIGLSISDYNEGIQNSIDLIYDESAAILTLAKSYEALNNAKNGQSPSQKEFGGPGTYDVSGDEFEKMFPKTTPKQDFLMRPGQNAVSFSPQDTIIGVKDPFSLNGGLTIGQINISTNESLSENNMREFAEMIGREISQVQATR